MVRNCYAGLEKIPIPEHYTAGNMTARINDDALADGFREDRGILADEGKEVISDPTALQAFFLAVMNHMLIGKRNDHLVFLRRILDQSILKAKHRMPTQVSTCLVFSVHHKCGNLGTAFILNVKTQLLGLLLDSVDHYFFHENSSSFCYSASNTASMTRFCSSSVRYGCMGREKVLVQ